MSCNVSWFSTPLKKWSIAYLYHLFKPFYSPGSTIGFNGNYNIFEMIRRQRKINILAQARYQDTHKQFQGFILNFHILQKTRRIYTVNYVLTDEDLTAKQIKILVDTTICAMLLRHTLIAHISGKEGSFNNMVQCIHQPVEK